MRRLEHFTVGFLPSTILTKDDPTGSRGYVTWSAVIDGRQWGKIVEVPGSESCEFPPDAVKKWTAWALEEIEKVQRMTDAEIAAHVDAVRAAEAREGGMADFHA